jgi:hypothetical protein
VRWTSATYGAGQEAQFTFTDVSSLASVQGLVLKWRTGSMIRVMYTTGSQVVVETAAQSQGTLPRLTIPGISFVAGDTFGAQALADGTVNVYRNGQLIGTVNVRTGTTPWPQQLATGGGQVGVVFAGTTNTGAGNAGVDDFRGGTLP